MLKTLRTSLLLPALLLSACASAQTPGSGVSREETREVPDFHGIQVGHGLSATVTVGPKSVRISGDENLLPLVRTEVVDGNLVARMEKDSRIRSGSLRLTISSPQVTSLGTSGGAHVDAEATATDTFTAKASGGSEITVRGLDAKQMMVEASGGAEVTLKGRVDTLKVEASGGSQVHGNELNLQALEVEASGGTQVESRPVERLIAEMSGGSTLRISSEPAQRDVSTSGGARVLYQKK